MGSSPIQIFSMVTFEAHSIVPAGRDYTYRAV
jgi:hypothetical protein